MVVGERDAEVNEREGEECDGQTDAGGAMGRQEDPCAAAAGAEGVVVAAAGLDLRGLVAGDQAGVADDGHGKHLPPGRNRTVFWGSGLDISYFNT